MKIVLYWRELCIIARCEHKVFLERDFRQDIQKRNFAHEKLVNAKSAIEKAFLNPVLQPGQSFSGVELATRNVSSGTAGHTVQKLQASLRQMRLARAGWAEEEETPLFTSQIQRELFNVTLAFTENLDGWQKVGCDAALLLEDDFLLLGRESAIENAKHLTFPAGSLYETGDAEELMPYTRFVQRFARHIAQKFLGLFRH